MTHILESPLESSRLTAPLTVPPTPSSLFFNRSRQLQSGEHGRKLDHSIQMQMLRHRDRKRGPLSKARELTIQVVPRYREPGRDLQEAAMRREGEIISSATFDDLSTTITWSISILSAAAPDFPHRTTLPSSALPLGPPRTSVEISWRMPYHRRVHAACVLSRMLCSLIYLIHIYFSVSSPALSDFTLSFSYSSIFKTRYGNSVRYLTSYLICIYICHARSRM